MERERGLRKMGKGKRLTPLKAIRKRCLDCSAYNPREVRLCPCVECPLYSYRMGVRPSTYEKRRASKGVEAVEEKIEGGSDKGE